MSRNQRPGKVKVYSGTAGPAAGLSAAQRRGGNALPAMAAGGSVLPVSGSTPDAVKLGGAWILALLFILGAALGGGLFTAFVPF